MDLDQLAAGDVGDDVVTGAQAELSGLFGSHADVPGTGKVPRADESVLVPQVEQAADLAYGSCGALSGDGVDRHDEAPLKGRPKVGRGEKRAGPHRKGRAAGGSGGA
ncbi:hypothetical protein GCM10012289_63970 [Nonomuraea cavernae]|uniref:Uncharacterized protein n=1 Tax=Nonomuraea cavernae TaxID=2045107 RepID=A0A918DRJ4_9ACTN|nr:hypothetical protein GCM10012289_63970 [Nonomuraea cavernae]